MIRAPFTIEWEYGPNQPAMLKPYRRFRRAVFGFIHDANGRVIRSVLWFRGKMV